MQNSRSLAIISCVIVFGVAAFEYAVGPLPVPRPHKLAVDTFPSTLGAWHGGQIAPIDPDIQARLPTSAIMDRVYSTTNGQSADVMLVTASDNLDIHNPKDCFPSQGWHLTNNREKVIQGQTVSLMDAQLDEQKMTVLYWTTGVYMPPLPPNALLRKVLAVRDRVVPRHESVSLFVRLMVPQSPHAEEAITHLAEQVMPPVHSLLEDGRQPGEQLTSLPQRRTQIASNHTANPMSRQKGI